MSEEFYVALINKMAEAVEKTNRIPSDYYGMYNVKRGLRNENGTGVLVGLTQVGSVHGYVVDAGEIVPDEGALIYRGMDLKDVVQGFQKEKRHGFEEVCYLLLFGELPTQSQLDEFKKLLGELRVLPKSFTENMILKNPSKDIMNKLQRSILVSYSYDNNPDDISVKNLLRQSLELIARFPTIVAYGYQAKRHYHDNKSLFIHSPVPELGTAENLLYMIRPDNKYTEKEAELLDLSLVIHAEHGGGNNSAFATHVVSSTGTDTYSAIATAVGSLKGPKHGGANLKVLNMIDNIKENISSWSDKVEIKDYLRKILRKDAFDNTGLIYGMGHAVYTLSDPRAVLLKGKAYELAVEKGREEEFALYENIENLSIEAFKELKGPDAVICANVDFYSGFVYDMLNIPHELYTPLFATARVCGWCAHRIEQVVSDNKIMRPAYKSVMDMREYVELAKR
ncbi:citrate synthase GltA [Peptoclostridium acidaminophilum DSM 3953]|uniref:Citrate synthase n=1 Tax=Peptoclostridium acidaminophilum DSM 3953 TaxID=1286171 RepID=W8TG78_PEPAC|nr:citrate/2-methylcitrate synthase [Peptoclostridium acidaminophilum]AHM56838.1 citrate synthase GltA [Peptoclostridium acidaminophilum DSM 3953]